MKTTCQPRSWSRGHTSAKTRIIEGVVSRKAWNINEQFCFRTGMGSVDPCCSRCRRLSFIFYLSIIRSHVGPQDQSFRSILWRVRYVITTEQEQQQPPPPPPGILCPVVGWGRLLECLNTHPSSDTRLSWMITSTNPPGYGRYFMQLRSFLSEQAFADKIEVVGMKDSGFTGNFVRDKIDRS